MRLKSIFLFFFCFSNFALAFTLFSSTNSKARGWSKKNLVYHLNSQNCPTNIRFNLEAAMALWNSIGSTQINLELSPKESTDSTAQILAHNFTDEALIICDPNMAAYGINPDSIPGFANVTYSGNNEIIQSYLVLNVQGGATSNISTFSDDLVQVITAHELGHTLGLGHSSDISALMYYSAGYKQNLALAQDDIEGMTYLYPRDETGGDQFMGGCALIKNNNKNKSGPLTKLLTLLFCLGPLLFLFLVRRKNLFNLK
jgi:hypothetical protein